MYRCAGYPLPRQPSTSPIKITGPSGGMRNPKLLSLYYMDPPPPPNKCQKKTKAPLVERETQTSFHCNNGPPPPPSFYNSRLFPRYGSRRFGSRYCVADPKDSSSLRKILHACKSYTNLDNYLSLLGFLFVWLSISTAS